MFILSYVYLHPLLFWLIQHFNSNNQSTHFWKILEFLGRPGNSLKLPDLSKTLVFSWKTPKNLISCTTPFLVFCKEFTKITA